METKIPNLTHQQKSAEIVASVHDLLSEILLRLPIKSLLRFKSVSKQWQSLITNPKFCHLHSSRQTNQAVGLLIHCSEIDTRFHKYVPFCDTSSPIKIKNHGENIFTIVKQSCNGLLLCSSSYIVDWKSLDWEYVYNPTTNQFSVLPELDNGDIGGVPRLKSMTLAFDPKISPHYKVVCVQELGSNSIQIVIYSSETGAWAVHGNPFTSYNTFGTGVYWNGAVHWMSPYSRQPRMGAAGFERCDSLYFIIEDQVLDKMPVVPLLHNFNCENKYYFGESCDHLHYVEIRQNEIQFDVFEMRRDYSEWFIKYKVDLSPVLAAYPEIDLYYMNFESFYYYYFSVYCIVRGEEKEEEESFLVLQIPGKAVQYNLVHKTFKNLQNFECEFDGREYQVSSSKRFQYTRGIQFIESMCYV